MTINEFLQSMNASGKRSFEGLVGELLSQLTGVHFYAARSGDQGGRDGRAVTVWGGEIAYECKRYSNETTLRDRELLGELAQAQQRRPELDVWILAASREVTDQNREPLRELRQGPRDRRRAAGICTKRYRESRLPRGRLSTNSGEIR